MNRFWFYPERGILAPLRQWSEMPVWLLDSHISGIKMIDVMGSIAVEVSVLEAHHRL